MLFTLTRSNLLRQLSDGNGTILRLTEILTVSHSVVTYFGELLKKQSRKR
jgi:hypothetical protein